MREMISRQEWRKNRKRKRRVTILSCIVLCVCFLGIPLLFLEKRNSGFIAHVIRSRFTNTDTWNDSKEVDKNIETLPEGITIKKEYLEPNRYSRPQRPLEKVDAVVIHYTANPGSSAQDNRDYFEGLATSKITSASSHYVVGLEGEVVQCIPLTEISYASNNRNNDTISIECCHPDKTGKFNNKTYHSLIVLTAEICIKYDLKKDDIIRHYDITGKLCPLYYVKHPTAWKKLKNDVMKEVEQLKSNDKKK